MVDPTERIRRGTASGYNYPGLSVNHQVWEFQTLLYYKMMGITPLVYNFMSWKTPNAFPS